MVRTVRWLLRLGVLAVFAGIWYMLPYVMSGPSRLLALIHLACLVAAVDFSVIVLVLSLIPYKRPRPDAASLAMASKRQQAGQP